MDCLLYCVFICDSHISCFLSPLVTHTHLHKLKKGCTQAACLACCTDHDACAVHREIRERALWKQNVLNRTTAVHVLARTKKTQAVRRGAFREPAFHYMGQTVQIWNLREYCQNAKRKADAVRRSKKRKAHSNGVRAGEEPPTNEHRNGPKRFRAILNEWYQNSTQTTTEDKVD